MDINKTYNIHNGSAIAGRYYKSEIIRYDKPALALMGSKIGEIYGMILTVTAYEEKGVDHIYTYRTPLVGRELVSAGNFGENEDYDKFYLFPDDRKMSPAFFKKLVCDYLMEPYRTFKALAASLNEHGCVVRYDRETERRPIICTTGRRKNVVFVESPYFDLYFKYKGKPEDIHPSDIEDLYRMQSYLEHELVFNEATAKFGEVGQWAVALNRRMMAYCQFGMYGIEQRDENYRLVGHIYNDGIYTYMLGKEIFPMGREEFLKLYPNAKRVFC